MIEHLKCASCNASLPLADAPSVSCWYCGAARPVPDELRRALIVARERTQAGARAAALWRRLEAVRVRRAFYVVCSVTPFALLAAGLGAGLAAALLVPAGRAMVPRALAWAVWLPLVPVTYFACKVGLRNLLASGVDWISATYASVPPASEGGPPGCRLCGSPLTVETEDVFVRCAYCDTESLVGVSAERVEAFAAAGARAEGSAARATELLLRWRRAARFQVVGRTLAVAGLVVFPLVWSLSRSWQSSAWSLALAPDVWFLGICLWWVAREAFLPPVGIDEVYEMAERFRGRDVAPAPAAEFSPPASLRRWDDNASERVNFLVPLIPTLLFAALQTALIWKG
ncbi:MAG TPA: hypothetical protein VN256_22065 [Pyrinomonadaceae bacterium]|nr:hypothetical protein [Pyrinomonadaceae bacterium]